MWRIFNRLLGYQYATVMTATDTCKGIVRVHTLPTGAKCIYHHSRVQELAPKGKFNPRNSSCYMSWWHPVTEELLELYEGK